jgi:hypothetical protein
MSNDDYTSFNGFFKSLGEAVTRSHCISCPQKDGGYIHPHTAELVQNATFDCDKLELEETRYREAASRARALIDLHGAMTDAEKSITSLYTVLDDLIEQDRDCVQRRQSLLMSLGSARDRLKSQRSLCEHLSEKYKVPEYPPPDPERDTEAQLVLSKMIDTLEEKVTNLAPESSTEGRSGF